MIKSVMKVSACVIALMFVFQTLPYTSVSSSGVETVIVSHHDFESGFSIVDGTNPTTNNYIKEVKKTTEGVSETIWTYERTGGVAFADTFKPTVDGDASDSVNKTKYLRTGIEMGNINLWHNLPQSLSMSDPTCTNPRAKVTVDMRIKVEKDDFYMGFYEKPFIGYNVPNTSNANRKLLEVYLKKNSPPIYNSENGTGTNYSATSPFTAYQWNYIRAVIDFDNQEVAMFTGPSLAELKPWATGKSAFAFRSNSSPSGMATVLGSIVFSGKGYVEIDDFSIYYTPLNKVKTTLMPFTNGNGEKISTLNEQTIVNASIKVRNWKDSSVNPVMVIAAYSKNNQLIGIKLNTAESGEIAPDDFAVISAGLDISEFTDVHSVKSYLWDSFVNASPLISPYGQISNYSPKYIFGVLQNSKQNLTANYNAGMRMAILALGWNSFYSSEGVKNTSYINEQKALLKSYRDEGFEVMLDFGTQYPPNWIYNYPNSRWKNQYGDEFSGNIGETAVNVVFNDLMRQKQEQFVRDVFDEFGTDFEIVRLGFMRYGELGYIEPNYNGKTNCYWAFDDIAQGETAGLPEGVSACPVPGWIPGTASTNNEDARKFLEWYIASLQNYHDWQITTVRKYFNNELAMLYPSWGLRDGQIEAAIKVNLDGTSGAEGTMEIQRGHDFKRFIEGLTDPNMIVYGTWIDSNPDWSSPTNPPPIEFLANLAKAHPNKYKVMGENTGGGGMTAMELTFKRVEENGLAGLMWAFEGDLYDGNTPVLSDYELKIREYQNK